MNPAALLTLLVALPGLAFAVLALLWLAGWHPPERFVHRLTGTVYVVASALAAFLSLSPAPVTAALGDWFSLGHYSFPVSLILDPLAAPFVVLTAILTGVIGAFSARYMHRESGYLRFFLLLHLFAFGSLLLFTAGSLDLLLAGWELVGVTSVFLVAFFQARPGPVSSAARIFAVYRSTDVGLLLAIVALHHFAGSTSFASLIHGDWLSRSSPLAGFPAFLTGFLLLLAAAGKSAQFPFTGWIPRAMEGPTPSSAIFYGAISVHAGTYLLLRLQPLLRNSFSVAAALVALGMLTAVLSTLAGRASADAKSSLAFASVTQLGIIFAEIGLGFERLVLWHVAGHAAVRTLQFLRAPSALHEHHLIHAAAGGRLEPTGVHLEALLPMPLRNWLYRLAVDRGHLDTLLDKFVTLPVLSLAARLHALESRLSSPQPQGPAVVHASLPSNSDA
jgi:NADH-quinone oxidoreductase subunit L